MNGPQFIAVLPSEVGSYGAAPGIVLALIRYRTSSTGGVAGVEREGHRWWRVTLRQLASETGLSVKAVRTALGALDGVVVVKHFPPLSDQSRAYRLAAQDKSSTSQLPNGAAADQPVAAAGIPDAPEGIDRAATGTPPCPQGHLHLYLKNLKEGGEAPPLYCPDHMPNGTKDSCPSCGHHRKRREAWDAEFEERRIANRGLVRQAIDSCRECDKFGRLDDLTDCPKHPNFRQYPEFAARTS